VVVSNLRPNSPAWRQDGTVTVTHWLGGAGPYSLRFWTSFHTAATASEHRHPAGRLALFPLRSELPRRRGYARRAWHRCVLRDGPPLGFEVRRDHCAQAETRTASAGRAVASRRRVRRHQRQTVVHLGGGGQRRRGPGHPRSTTARPQGGAQADAKTPEEAGRHSSHH